MSDLPILDTNLIIKIHQMIEAHEKITGQRPFSLDIPRPSDIEILGVKINFVTGKFYFSTDFKLNCVHHYFDNTGKII